MRIGLVGKNGSGKSVACKYIERLGYQVFSLSDVLREDLRRDGHPLDRDSLTKFSNFLKETEGLSVLAKRCWDVAEGIEKVVFDSIRHPVEAKFLRDKGVFLMGIKSSIQTRFERIKARGLETDDVSFETFQIQDNIESDGQSFGQNIHETLSYCQVVLDNDDTLDSFYDQLKNCMIKNGWKDLV